MTGTASSPAANPFSTRAVRPGAMPFRFPANVGPEILVRRLAECGWWGEITGPHGSGKTTLLKTLTPFLEQQGRQLVCWQLKSGRRVESRTKVAQHETAELPASRVEGREAGETFHSKQGLPMVEKELTPARLRWLLLRDALRVGGDWHPETLVVVDGYEQLGWAIRWLLKRLCRRKACGLLVTSHRSVGLPRVFATEVTHQLAHDLVRGLLPADCELIDTADIDACFHRHPGDLRELLFALYDVYEYKRRVCKQ